MGVIGCELDASGPREPFLLKFLKEYGILFYEVLCFAAVVGDVVEFPLAVIESFVAAHELPVAFAYGTGTEVIEVKGALSKSVSS